MYLWINKGTTTARRFIMVIIIIIIANFLLPLLRQGVTSIPFPFFGVIDRALRKLVHIKKKKDGNGKNFVVATSLHFFALHLSYMPKIITIRFRHLLADNFTPFTSNFVNCKELESVDL